MSKEKWRVTQMGQSLLLDFKDVERVDLGSHEAVESIISRVVSTMYPNESVDIKSWNGSQNGVCLSFLLSSGSHIIAYTWKEEKTICMEWYDPSDSISERAKQVEEFFCDTFGWQECSSALKISRGDKCKLICNESENKSEIIYNARLIYREMTPFQELRVYDTVSMGRVLLLDDMVQITQDLVDNYTIDMVAGVIRQKDSIVYDHILIIGGGDMLIANYLLLKFQDIVKKITICEIDERVIHVVKQFFFNSSTVNESIESGKLQIVCKDGSLYAKELSEKGEQVDGIIIDCTDYLPEGGVANSLFTEEFYNNIKSCMKIGSFFSQQLSYQEMIPISKAKWEKIGLPNYQIVICETPEYSENLPLAYVQRLE